MNTALIFDHCYQKVTEPVDYERFESLGFTLSSASAEHPYSLLSNFLFFGSPEAAVNGPTHYLEFCHIRDVAGELAYSRKSDPTAGERDLFVPGYSLRSTTSLEACFAANQAQWATLRPNLSHRNYDWIQGGDEHRPGWNFLHFDGPVIPGVVVWLTEYEATPRRHQARLDRIALAQHRNGVKAIGGFVFDLTDDDKNKLSLLTNSPWCDGVLTMHDGMKIFALRDCAVFGGLFSAKTLPFKAVILECPSLAHFCEVSGLRPLDGRRLVQIASAQPESWDILVTEP
ncbi:MAG TPA: hypothetical protein VEZ89_12880 [Rubrivivax sp.]|nr:hypothetical protein [Rubrivivax sp.]